MNSAEKGFGQGSKVFYCSLMCQTRLDFLENHCATLFLLLNKTPRVLLLLHLIITSLQFCSFIYICACVSVYNLTGPFFLINISFFFFLSVRLTESLAFYTGQPFLFHSGSYLNLASFINCCALN